MDWRSIMKKSRTLLLLMFLSIPAIAISAQDGSNKSRAANKLVAAKDASANSDAAHAAVKPATDDPNYSIGAEDELNVNVWKEPDISRTVPVRPDGKISLPFLTAFRQPGLTRWHLGPEVR